MKKRAAMVMALLLVLSTGAYASVVNGGFETGDFTGWSVFAPSYASVVTATYGSGPTEGTYEALLRTPTTGFSNLVGLNSFVGLNLLDLTLLGNGVTMEGTAIRQTFYADAGETLSFDFNFLTNCPLPTECLPWYDNDFGFVSLVGLEELADANDVDEYSPTIFDYQTGFGQYSHTFNASGWYSLAIGVVDVIPANLPGAGDESALLIDNVALQTVPEPATLSLFGLGLGAMAARYVRRRKA